MKKNYRFERKFYAFSTILTHFQGKIRQILYHPTPKYLTDTVVKTIGDRKPLKIFERIVKLQKSWRPSNQVKRLKFSLSEQHACDMKQREKK